MADNAASRNLSQNDPSHDLLKTVRQPLDSIFKPRTVAVIGASERAGSVGRTILWNLIANPFGGTVYPVNPSRPSVLGIRAYKSVSDIPDQVDLAVIVTPATSVPGIIKECTSCGVKGAIIISAGFKEIGEAGVRLEQEIMQYARAGNMRIVGPNCLGVMSPLNGLNATFAGNMARPGNVALISQSGALLTAILDWSFQENVGFSQFVSVGSMLDVGWGDLIHYLGNDSRTSSILIYMESIGNAREFLSAAREVALQKPIIVIKAGRSAQAAKAAASHTGTLAGSDEVLSAAFRRSGVLRVDTISDLFYMAEVLAKQPRPKGPRLTILTNAGGPGVLSTDALVAGQGELTEISKETFERYNEILPPEWSHGNPVDILGDASPERYAKALEVAAQDPNSDGMLVILTPQDMTRPTEIAEQLKPYANSLGKPVLASWMGGAEVATGDRILSQAGIPTFNYPDTAARVFNYMWRYSYALKSIYETPELADDGSVIHTDQAAQLIDEARAAGRTLLTEFESKALLKAYGIPTVETLISTSADDAVRQAEGLGFPVVLKLHSNTITHKTDVGGVRLNLRDAAAVRDAFNGIHDRLVELGKGDAFDGVTVQKMVKLDGYEIIVGSSNDQQFGPVLLFGSGGQLVEVYKDRSLALPPLNTTLARRMMEQTKIYKALQGVRGRKPVDMAALEQLMVRFSQLVVEQRAIKEIDINPLLVSDEQIIALDARVVLHDASIDDRDLPQPAIRPYPRHLISNWTMKDGTLVTTRPIRPEDEPEMVEFHNRLSEQSVYLRYASVLKLSTRVAHERLARICFVDYNRQMALVVERRNPESGQNEIIGVGRLTHIAGTHDGEFALVVVDEYQHKGLGTELLNQLIEVGRAEGLERIVADVLKQNNAMQGICRKLGFDIVDNNDPEDPMIRAVKAL